MQCSNVQKCIGNLSTSGISGGMRFFSGKAKRVDYPNGFSGYFGIFLQRRFCVLKGTVTLCFRNVVENTLADTPSGYIQDPANHPKRMVTYRKLTPENQATIDIMEREEELMLREELAYDGYTTVDIQEWKAVVFKSDSTREELESACKNLQEILKELVGLLGHTVEKRRLGAHCSHSLHLDPSKNEINETSDGGFVNVVVNKDDCNHLRYIIALGMRRLGNYDEAENLCMDILSTDHGNCEALECLMEIYTGTERPEKIRHLLDQLVQRKVEMKLKEGENSPLSALSIATHDREGNELEFIETALVLLSDIIVEAASLHYAEHGEGSTSRFFLEALSPIFHALGQRYTPLLLESLFRCMDEQHVAARFRSCSTQNSEEAIGLVISFLKMLLVRHFSGLMPHPLRFEFHILSKLHSALCYSRRKHESYKICERLIKLYQENTTKFHSSMQAGKSEGDQELLDDLEPSYKTALFQFIEDRALDSLVIGKRLCIQAIEEYPEEPYPWETLALILHKEDPINGLDDAVVAAKKAFSLDPKNLRVILTLANFYKAQKRYNLYETMVDRYQLVKFLIESGASEEDIKPTLKDIETLDKANPQEFEPDQVAVQFADLREHMERMEIAHTYSMPIDKEPRVFSEQPVTAPILDPSINLEKPQRLVDVEKKT